MYIYKITNIINKKIYIGQTIQKPSERWSRHKKDAKRMVKTPLYASIRKYGVSSFKMEVIEQVSDIETLNKKEIEYIKTLNTVAPNGFNLKDGGQNGKHSQITINRMKANHWSKKHDYINPNKGKTIKQENNKNWKEFFVFDEKNNLIGCWKSQSQCARDLNLGQGNIGSCLRKKRSSTCGYFFKYIKENK